MKALKTSLGLAAAAALVSGAAAQTVETLPAPARPTAPAQTSPIQSPSLPTPVAPAAQPPTTGQPIPAQGLQKAGGDGMPPAPRLQRSGSIEYMSGGAGFESRDVIEGAGARFSLHNVFSGKGGAYVVAQKVTVHGPNGVATEISDAGPLLSIALPPGKYTIEAVVDGRVQKKTVNVAQQPVKLNWNWPGV